jgi:hypothetical protein
MRDQTGFGIRYQRIKNLYIWTACVGACTGLMILLTPTYARYMFGFPSVIPPQDPVIFGFIGCFWLCIALTALLGLKAPLQFVPIFLIQLTYKCLWFLFVFLPLAMQGEFPLYGTLFALINALWIFLDIKAIPFRYLVHLITQQEPRLPSAAASAPAELAKT